MFNIGDKFFSPVTQATIVVVSRQRQRHTTSYGMEATYQDNGTVQLISSNTHRINRMIKRGSWRKI